MTARLTGQQRRVLEALWPVPDMGVTELAAAACGAQAGIGRTCGSLADRGLVVRFIRDTKVHYRLAEGVR